MYKLILYYLIMMFWIWTAFCGGIIVGFILMAIAYEIHIYCKNRNKE